jgi:hypothetical protein
MLPMPDTFRFWRMQVADTVKERNRRLKPFRTDFAAFPAFPAGRECALCIPGRNRITGINTPAVVSSTLHRYADALAKIG